ncbi:MAG: cation-translocating P-type ATPase [Anaerolineales bacterium]|nr:cation-translocating P-type ATPase [Anaerolineales bacterium]
MSGNQKQKHWHVLEVQETLDALQTDPEVGLSEAEASQRLAQYGRNELVEHGVKSPWKILFEQFKETMVIVLMIAAVVSVIVGDMKDAIAILAIVVLNAILGFVQEYRAERAMAALKQMAAPLVRVRRDGHVKEIDSHLLVPGDVVLLEAGNAIPADARLVESINLRVTEASLTGESQPVDKNVAALDQMDLPLGDRHNMVYMGTAVNYGRGTAVIAETGMRTQLGKIAEMIQTVDGEQTPLQKRMSQLGRSLALAALAIVAVVFVLGLLRGEDIGEMFLTAVAMAVAAIPEGLPAVVTISLALGAQRMLRRQALIRKLPAVETLGSVTVICSDKTGTLTENRMTVTVLDVLGETQHVETLLNRGTPMLDAEARSGERPQVRSLGLLTKAAALCNDAVLEEDPNSSDCCYTIGDPTEGALVVAAAKLGLWKPDLEQRWPRVAEVPFTSERKRMTTVHRVAITPEDPSDAPWRTAPYVAFCKGAVDEMLDITTQVWSGDQAIPVTEELRQRILSANNELAQNGQRVLGVAFRPLAELPQESSEETLEAEMTFIGLVAMIDPPRPEVKEAVETCQTAGIRPVMITGDHPLTAKRIAQDLGISSDSQIITGQQLSKMTTADLDQVVEDVSVYARVSPEHKLKIVEALQKRGHIVAMTGDGVNDAPALRRSDIGVAMGITGTDVSKEAADMVLLDDNFATIVRAVGEGRTIYDNVRKFIKYTMTSNAGEIIVMLLAPFFGMPLPLTALQILWINLVTDGLPGLALGLEPPERNTMKRPPYAPGESIFARGMGPHILWVGPLMGLVSLGVGLWGFLTDNPYWPAMVFTTLTLSQMGHALAVRSNQDSLFRIGLLSNKPMLGAVLLTFVLQMIITYVPVFHDIFGTMALPLPELLISLGASTLIFWAVEIEKLIKRRH